MCRLGNSLLEAWQDFTERAAQTGVGVVVFSAVPSLLRPLLYCASPDLAPGSPRCQSWRCGDFHRQLEKRFRDQQVYVEPYLWEGGREVGRRLQINAGD